MHDIAPPARRTLVSFAAPEAYAPMCRVLLARLGYAIVDATDFDPAQDDERRPDALLVDERRLAEVEDDGGPPVPIIALVGRQGVTGADVRVMGAVPRPAGLHELYRVLQQVLEEQPRSSPRVPTHLAARCSAETLGGWKGTVVMLSENGCLLRSSEPLLLGSKLDLRFALPRHGDLALEAEVAYQLPPDAGLVFSAAPPAARRAIQRFLTEALYA